MTTKEKQLDKYLSDPVKLAIAISFICGMWADLKSDFRSHVKDFDMLKYRVEVLEYLMKAPNFSQAILPKEPKIEENEFNTKGLR